MATSQDPSAPEATALATPSEPVRKSNPIKRALLWVAALSTAAVVALVAGVVVLFLLLGMLISKGLPDWANPFDSTTTMSSQKPLELSLRDLAEYHGAVGTYQVVVQREMRMKHLPSFIAGEKITIMANGSVDGIVDFTNLGKDKVVIDQAARTAVITLPKPRLGATNLDMDKSQVLDVDRGLFTRAMDAIQENPLQDQDIYQEASRKLAEAATGSDILQRTEDNTRKMLTELAQSLGFTSVTVNFV